MIATHHVQVRVQATEVVDQVLLLELLRDRLAGDPFLFRLIVAPTIEVGDPL